MNKLYLCFVFTLLSLMDVYSQRQLSLEECRNLAIENNKSLKAATAEERVAYYERKEAFTKYFPQLSFSGLYLRNEKNLNLLPSSVTMPSLPIPNLPLPPAGTEITLPDALRKVGEVDIQNIWVLGFTLTQPIFMGGKIVAYNDVKKYAEELAHSKKNTELVNLIVEVDNAYWQVVSVYNKKKLADSYVELLEKIESDMLEMEKEGVATKADKLSVSVKLNEAEMTQTKAENGLSLAKMYLCQLCGLEIGENISLQDEALPDLNVTSDASEIPDINEALNNRNELKSLNLATKMYKKNEKIALSEFLPQLGLLAHYGWTNPSMFDGVKKELGGMWSVGLSLKVPLNFYSSSAKLNAAKAQSVVSQYKYEEAKEKIELQANQSVYKLNEAAKKMKMASKNMEKADENLRYAKVGFEEGVIPPSDVLAAHTAWISAHSEFIDAQIDIKLCKVYLDQVFGRIATK